MYCPKCGAQNQDHLAYCRECGENLQVISQAMKKYSPVALVSKFDAVIEKKNERFRRDAILNALQGTVVIILTVFTPFIGSFFAPINILMFLVGILMLFQSGWFFLAYRRSLELRKKLSIFVKKPLSIFGNDESLPPDISQIETLPGDTGAATNKLVAVNDSQSASIYCPGCGVQNLENVLYCCACGTNLDFSVRPQGLERYLPAFLVNKLDAVITKNEKADYKSNHKSGWTLLIVAVIILFNVIIQGWLGDWGFAAFYLVLGFVIVVTAGWNLIAYRRNLEKENKSLDEPSISFTGKFKGFVSTPVFKSAAIFLCIFMLIPLGLTFFGIAGGGIFGWLAFITFAALIVRFLQYRHSKKDKEYLDDTSAVLPTSELPSQATSPLASPPLSFTEATTSHLEPATMRKEDEIPTARILDKQRR